MRVWGILAAALALAFTSIFSDAEARTVAQYDGLTLIAYPPDPGTQFDIDIATPEQGLARIRDAIDLIERGSPHGRAGIARLKGEGAIYIVYDPNFPRKTRDLGTIRRALFIPTFLDEDDPDKTQVKFPVVVSRHGINAPTEFLAAILIHELVGHGIQQAEGRITESRERELECEAWLHEEWAYQEFGVDKSSTDMIDFRRQLEGSALSSGRASFRRRSFLQGRSGMAGASQEGHCSPFKRYLAEHAPNTLAHFKKLNPDVAPLLAALHDYVKYLDGAGVTNAALTARAEFQASQLNEVYASGSPEQQYRAALALKQGLGMPQDDRRAAQFLEKAARGGHVEAQYRIALAYAEGDGVIGDPGRAARWYAKAAEQNHAAAQRDLGRLYEFGRGVARNAELAAKWYRAAAEAGDAAGQNNFAVFLLAGRGGVGKDPAKAAELLKKSVDQEFAPAVLNLARLYAAGLGVARDPAKAAELYALAADNGDPDGQYELARLYLNGRGVERNAKVAEQMFAAAAKQGHEESQVTLARMYARGLGVEKNPVRAAELLRGAAEQGNVEAQGLLAAALAGGQGTARNPVEGYFWASLAAREKGRSQLFARNLKTRLEKSLDPSEIAATKKRIETWRPAAK